jgi:hypothetical protein
MKRYMLATLFLTACCVLCADAATNEVKRLKELGKEESVGLSKDELKKIGEAQIAAIRNGREKSTQTDKKYQTLEVNTLQSQDEMPGFRICVAVELTDKSKKTYLAEFTANQPDGLDSEYVGQDYWKLYLPEGDLEKLKITAYAVQYGFMDENTFLIIDEQYDHVKSMDELKSRTTTPLPGSIRLSHYHMYADSTSGGERESTPIDLKAVK